MCAAQSAIGMRHELLVTHALWLVLYATTVGYLLLLLPESVSKIGVGVKEVGVLPTASDGGHMTCPVCLQPPREAVAMDAPLSGGAGLILTRKSALHPRSEAELQSLAHRYVEEASAVDVSKGDGQKAWLKLLAAFDYAPRSDLVLENLVRNYLAVGYPELARDACLRVLEEAEDEGGQHATAANLLQEVQEKHASQLAHYDTLAQAAARRQASRASGNEEAVVQLPQEPQFTFLFPTILGRWQLEATPPHNLEAMHQEFYDATVYAYTEFRKDILAIRSREGKPPPTDTELNHDFFSWQMGILQQTGDYWEGYRMTTVFSAITDAFRDAATEFLIAHGFTETAARRKANHNTVFWVSVHTPDSVHEPHNTEDSLIGGVYYVTVPPRSGKLAVFDPRGMNPSTSMADHRKEAVPPFHRDIAVTPKPGLLVLFGGWAIHTVLPSTGMPDPRTDPNAQYRISISVNLKGEWQDTAPVVFDNVKLQYPPSGSEERR